MMDCNHGAGLAWHMLGQLLSCKQLPGCTRTQPMQADILLSIQRPGMQPLSEHTESLHALLLQVLQIEAVAYMACYGTTIHEQSSDRLVLCGTQAPAAMAPAAALALLQGPIAAAGAIRQAQAPAAFPSNLAPGLAPAQGSAQGPVQAIMAVGAPITAPAVSSLLQGSGPGSGAAHTPVAVIAAPVAGCVVLLLLSAAVALAQAGMPRKARKAQQSAPDPAVRGADSFDLHGAGVPLSAGASHSQLPISEATMALPKMPIRQESSRRNLCHDIWPLHLAPASRCHVVQPGRVTCIKCQQSWDLYL